MSEPQLVIQTEEADLVNAIAGSQSSENVVYTVLKTDERVIARVTDGIYRQPASALRELISNAYDADATKVVVKTDAPRFSRISIEDNGHGMSPQALAHMLMHIGGSAKRREEGKELGITAEDNSVNSPGGRKLIGKIGIGIFSVAQLTYNFQIITKTKGDSFRTVAIVNLRQYSDEALSNEKEKYESGKVSVWREKASDTETNGTTIILNNIRPQARDTLQSKERWGAVEHSEDNIAAGETPIPPPKYHVGKIDSSGDLLRETNGKTNNLPWEDSDSPTEAFNKLVNAIWSEIEHSNQNPQLEHLFDYYLQMIWNLSLAIPVPYIQQHLFDTDLSDWSYSYKIANEPKGSAKEIENPNHQRVRDLLGLTEGVDIPEFEVCIDDLQLFRPIKYKALPTGGHALQKPLILLGKCKEDFSRFPVEFSGGPLSFEAYLFWTSKVAPAEHRGSLIRIHGASGTLFDSSFMRYQIAEQTRLKQITCEIYIHEGFDSALNIDRESFNFAHPHAVFLTRWLHSALRQLATTQKRIAGVVRTEVREETKEQQKTEIQQIAIEVWKQETKDEFSSPPVVVITDKPDVTSAKDSSGENADIVLVKSQLKQRRSTSASSQINSEKIKAITQILASFGLFENLTQQQQNRLLNAIYNVLESTE